MSKIDNLTKKLKKVLIDEKKPIFVDTNIYKYYVEYQQYIEGSLSNEYIQITKQIDINNSYRLFEFLIKHNIKIKENQMLEEEIKDVIKNSRNIKEKHYYLELRDKLNIDPNKTEYSDKEKQLAKQLSPKSKDKIRDQDFIIVICCKKDNTKVITTKDRDDLNKCLKEYSLNKDKFNNIDHEIILIKLDQIPILIPKIEEIIGGDNK